MLLKRLKALHAAVPKVVPVTERGLDTSALEMAIALEAADAGAAMFQY
jgi:hypothetical protein